MLKRCFWRIFGHSPESPALPTESDTARACCAYDLDRLVAKSGVFEPETKGKLRAKIVRFYHVLEKGLTMPERRVPFGKNDIGLLLEFLSRYVDAYGLDDSQVRHGIGVVRSYALAHTADDRQPCGLLGDGRIERAVNDFLAQFPQVPAANQFHFTREEFYANRNAPFPEFARSRHTVRHYAGISVPQEKIDMAVALAQTAPMACNRPFCRAHCVSNRGAIDRILELQNGNRGFGHLADKLLVVTSDLECTLQARERNDLYVNGGMFLMNLCYALYHYEVAYCILNWSKVPEDDRALRRLLPLRESESVIAILTCGEAPEEFDVAASPRSPIEEMN